jgi:hypothetical protein
MESDAKIQQYLLLAKSARGRALCELINKATAEPGLFAFGELLDTPSIAEVIPREDRARSSRALCLGRPTPRHARRAARARTHTPRAPRRRRPRPQLRQGEHAPFVLLLELFCYGTWPEYKGEAS